MITYKVRAFATISGTRLTAGGFLQTTINNLNSNRVMPTQSTAATIFATSHPNVKKRLSTHAVVIATILFIAGVALLAISYLDGRGYSPLNIVLMAAGGILILFAMKRAFSNSKEVVYTPTGSRTEERSLFFDLKYQNDLKNCILTGDFPAATDLRSEMSGNIRMDVILSRDKTFAAVQLLQFVPYAYQPVTQVQYFTQEEAVALCSFVAGCEE